MNRYMLWVMICNALVAVAAFGKDMLLARYAGTSAEADAFTIAFFITDSIAFNWLATSFITAAVAVLSKLRAEGGSSGALRRTWGRSLVEFTAMAAAVAIALAVSAPSLFASELPSQLTRIMAPVIVIYTLFAAGTAYLQSANRFLVPAAAPLLAHGAVVAAVIVVTLQGLPVVEGMHWAAISVVAGAMGATVLVFLFLRGAAAANQPAHRPGANPSSGNRLWRRNIWKIFGAYSLLVASALAVLLWERGLGISLGVGVASSLNYAYRISQVPVWVIATAIATVMFPKLSSLHIDGRTDQAELYTQRMMGLVFVAMLPVILSLWLLSEPVVVVLFERGAFQSESVQLTAALLRGYAFSLLGHSVSAIFIRYRLAAGETLKPAAVVLISSALTVVVQLALVQLFGTAGIGYGAAVGATLQGTLLAIPLLRGKARDLQLQLSRGGTVLLAAGLLCVVLFASLQVWNGLSVGGGEGRRILFLFITLSIGFAVYALPLRKILIRLLASDVV